jgi:prepilin-type processing-associated H-X9-DG protein
MYEADFRYFPGAGNDLDPIGQPPWFVLSPECWVANLTPYLATNSPIFICPDYYPLVTNSQSYGYNAGGSCQQNCPPWNLGLGLGKGFGFISPASVAAPTDMIALGDLQLPPSVARFVISPWHKQPLGNVDSVIPTRHAGGSVMAFLDCHVEWLKRPRWIAENESVRLRWNNDHQPHPETW